MTQSSQCSTARAHFAWGPASVCRSLYSPACAGGCWDAEVERAMALMQKLAKFGIGIATGGAIGAAIGTLTAPADGETFRNRLRKHFAAAKTAGETARTAKQNEL